MQMNRVYTLCNFINTHTMDNDFTTDTHCMVFYIKFIYHNEIFNSLYQIEHRKYKICEITTKPKVR